MPNPAVNGSPPPHPLLGSSVNGLASANGKTRALPSATRRRPRWVMYSVFLGGLLLLGVGIVVILTLRPAAARPDVLLHTVKRESLDVTVSEKGTLESASNIDVTCRVKAGQKQGGFASTINWVIDDGTRVKKNQVIMLLDDSDLQEKKRDQQIKVLQAYALKVGADKTYLISSKDGERVVADQRNVLNVAKLDLDKFIGLTLDSSNNALAAVIGSMSALSENGGFRQQIDDITGKVRLAESNVEQNFERAAWADRMYKMKYYSAAQAQAERSKLESSQEDLRSLRTQRMLLVDYEKRKSLPNFQTAVENAQRLLEQRILEEEGNREKNDIDRQTKTSIYNDESDKLKEIEDQLKECRIVAPQDGMVVYFKNESNRFNNSQQGLIEQGAQVKEGQKMLRIPNLERMQVNTKVHEAMVSRIRADERKNTNFVEQLQVGMLTTIDPFLRLMGQKEEVSKMLHDEYRQQEYHIVSYGQEATIKVDAKPGLLFKGRVKSVAHVASQADSWISDVKLYPTIVVIEGKVEELNPDMSAEVTIHIRGIQDVLTVPLQSVVGGSELGSQRKVFVKTDTGYEEKEVTLGIYNDKVIEVREGLHEGDQVVINPKVLLGDSKQKTRDGAPEAEKSGGKGKGKGKKKGGGGPQIGGGDDGAPAVDEKKGDPAKKRGGKARAPQQQG